MPGHRPALAWSDGSAGAVGPAVQWTTPSSTLAKRRQAGVAIAQRVIHRGGPMGIGGEAIGAHRDPRSLSGVRRSDGRARPGSCPVGRAIAAPTVGPNVVLGCDSSPARSGACEARSLASGGLPGRLRERRPARSHPPALGADDPRCLAAAFGSLSPRPSTKAWAAPSCSELATITSQGWESSPSESSQGPAAAPSPPRRPCHRDRTRSNMSGSQTAARRGGRSAPSAR